ncbi:MULTISPECIES: hypothetical protein [Pseudomonas syringae group]|uniref:Uncharacterized protein n=2 Tax=Pseudomonas syringae group TaxID=136849 RepID=A0AAW4E8A4_PSESX|nr:MULTISPECIES: hypothetical protein [Pseudomonas syringae group]KGK95558.1 hypothetical protein NB04_09915 [Pseudomonas syringae pv. tomato]KUR40764.1 hypothetical protein PSTA9_04367 [Pseudomonas syringae pv. tomato]KUR47571.1 hypothetical protein PST407_02637 [Pseudomonas syringae pv. tomato]MBI6697671.1 hypothetical protein [Pseudomonas syringae]MBI6717122.1 hypothetical protein [Pseudomonas syringae]
MSQYIVLSLKHTKRRDKAITLWRSNDTGYCWALEPAGVYTEVEVLDRLGYYNSGCSNIAVPAELVIELCENIEYDTKENGLCLPNRAGIWSKLLAAVIRPTQYEPKPEYRGAKYTEKSLWNKRQRCEQVNQVIKIIGDNGRRFFFSESKQRYAKLEVDQRGKVWLIDDYTGKRVFTPPTTWGGRWKGFSHGGTLKDLIERFRDYICEGKQMPLGWLGPERFDDSNIWGYEEQSMKAVRDQAGALPVFIAAIAEAA